MNSLWRRFAPTADDGTTSPPLTGYWLFAGHLLTIWGLALSNALMALAALWSLKNRHKLQWSWRRDAPLFAPAGIYAIFFVISVATSLEPAVSAGELRDLLSWITLGLAPVLIRGENAVRRLFDAILAMTLLLAVHGIFQYYLTDYGDLHQRIVGLFSHYQTFAGVLLIGTLILAARLAADGWRNPGYWVALGIITWTLQLSLTRGAWVAAAVTLAILAWVRARKYFFAGALALVLFFSFLAPDSWTERWQSITDLSDKSNYDRLCMAEAATFMIAERPLFGIGPEVVGERYSIYRHPTAPRMSIPHLHNTFLQRAAEQGLMGLGSYLVLMIAGLALAWREFRRHGGINGSRADLYLAVFLVLVGFNVAGLFEDNWRDTEVRRLMLFVLAVPLCLSNKHSSNPSLSDTNAQSGPAPDSDSNDEDPHP